MPLFAKKEAQLSLEKDDSRGNSTDIELKHV